MAHAQAQPTLAPWRQTLARARGPALVLLFTALALGEGAAQAVLGVAAATALAGAWAEGRLAATLRASWQQPTTRALLAYAAWAIITMLASRYGVPAGRHGSKLYNLLPLLVVPMLASATRPVWRERAVAAFLGAATLASVFGVFQHLYGVHWGAELIAAPRGNWQIMAPVEGGRFVAGGFHFNRLKLAHVLLVCIAAALPLAFAWRGRRQWLVVAGLLACTVGLLLTFARGAAVALAFAAVVMGALFWWRARQQGRALPSRRQLFIGVAVSSVLATAVLAQAQVRERLATVFQRAAYGDRVFLWQRAIEIIADHPWLGIGYGKYPDVCSVYYDRVDPAFIMRTQAHNQWLTVFAEGGVLALLLWLWLHVAIWRGLNQNMRKGDALAYGAAIAFIASLLISIVHDPFFQPSTALALTSLFALGLSVGDEAQ